VYDVIALAHDPTPSTVAALCVSDLIGSPFTSQKKAYEMGSVDFAA
jgi:hypothetical protein